MVNGDEIKSNKNSYSANPGTKISIIIVTFNAAATLQQCLDSIYKQIHKPIEIIVIDGASSDGTVQILQQNSEKITYWRSETDAGIYDAMNKGIEYITGNWVYFLGADDVLFADFSQLSAELSEPGTIYYASVLTRGLKRFGKVSVYHMAKTGIFHQAIIYPASVFKKYKYNLKYRIYADYDLNMRCYKDKSLKWEFRDYIIANFNHTGLSGSEKDDAFEKDKAGLIYENFGLPIWSRYLLRIAKRSIFNSK